MKVTDEMVERACVAYKDLTALINRYLSTSDEWAQTGILAVLMGAATRGACESGMPLPVVLEAIRAMYAEYEREKRR